MEQSKKLFMIKDMKVHYGGSEILKGISLKILEGEIVTLIGGNGAGKTTTLRAVCGLKMLTSGELWFEGNRIDLMPPQKIVRTGISHVPEGRGLFPYMSVAENLKVGAYLQNDKNEIRDDLAQIYASFPVLKARNRQLAGTLSGGEQQMLAIACALMSRPKLLLLDEPSTGLAPVIVGEVGKVISQINKDGTSILLVEQNARLALGLSHRGYVLETGLIVLSGKADELKRNERVRKAYLGK